MSAAADRSKSVFLAALNEDSVEQRERFLDQACDGDAELRRRVDRLIAAHEMPDDLLDRTEAVMQDQHLELSGQMIGP